MKQMNHKTREQFVELKTNGKFSLDIDIFMTLFWENQSLNDLETFPTKTI